jgi:phosphate transport system substrate-binding protein
VQSITEAAAASAKKLPASTDYRVSIVNAPGARSYPISSFTWLLVYRIQPNATKAAKLVNFIRWALRDGQKSAPTLDYAPLPAVIVANLDQRLKTIRVATR